MSLFDDASLVLIPDGAKDGKLYSVKPTDGTGDFTFTRGSNLAATRVDENGLIEKGRENLLLHSNQFDTNWFINGTGTLTSGQAGYDGSNDAWLLTKSAASTYLSQSTSLSGISTFSVYAKAGTNTHLAIWIRNANEGKFFDLVNGTIGSDYINTPIDAKIESVGNGWYRCSITTDDATNNCRIYPADADGDVSGTSGSIYIQDAQLEVGLVATDYIETTTTTAVSGITEDLPRIDYSGGASCPSLLLEPQRTNLVTQSEYFGTAWTADRLETTDWLNQLASPDGTVTATKLIQQSGQINAGYLQQSKSVSAGEVTFSAFAKKGTRHWIVLRTNATGSNLACWFNTDTGTIGSVNSGLTAKIEEYPNGWYRCSITCTSASGGAFQFYNTDKNGTLSVADDGGYQYIWGAQVEEGSYPTSYIPTYGTSVTRLKSFNNSNDIVDTPISFGANDDFTFFYEGEFKDFDGMIFGGGTGVGDDYRNYLWITSGTLRLRGFGEVQMGNASHSISKNTNTKILVKRNGSVITFFVDGVKLTTTSSSTPNSAFTFRSFGWSYNLNNYTVYGSAKQFIIFPTALTDSECIALTTL